MLSFIDAESLGIQQQQVFSGHQSDEAGVKFFLV
jgi:hypothetical protein